MRMDKFSYAGAEGCLYEAMRWKNTKGVVEPEREGKALIDPTRTYLNQTYVHPCLQPRHEFAEMTKDERDAKRGEAIAAYHNSQTGSQARAVMEGKKQSQAIGVVATLPRENPWVQRLELTEEEYTYLCDKMIEPPHDDGVPRKRDAEMEKTIKEKLKTVEMTPAERKECSKFLKGVIKAWLKECGIRQKDVLFWAIHFDESFPHIHCVALPTQEKVYEEDVYSKRVKKDGTRTLLHAKGSKAISYSITPFYAGKTIDDKGDEHYPFFEKYHPNIVEKLSTDEKLEGEELEEYLRESIFQETPEEEFALRAGLVNRYGLSEEARAVAPSLITGKTVGNGYRPADFEHETREQLVMLAEANRRLEEKQAKMQQEFTETYASMKSQLQEIKNEKQAAQSDALAAREELETVNKQLAEANANIEIAYATVAELEEQTAVVARKHSESKSKFREFFGNFKAIFTKLVSKALDVFFNKHLEGIINAETASERKRLVEEARKEMLGDMYEPMQELEADASPVLSGRCANRAPEEYNWLDLPAEPQAATSEEMAAFRKAYNQKRNFAIGRVFAAFEEDSSKAEPKYAHLRSYFAVSAGAEKACASPAMELVLQDYYNREKYVPLAEAITDEDEYNDYKQGLSRACRALDYLDDYIKSGQLDLEEYERE